MPVENIKQFICKQGLTENVDSAEKEIFKIVGKCKTIDFDDFYKLFCKGIFRIALIDMIDTI